MSFFSKLLDYFDLRKPASTPKPTVESVVEDEKPHAEFIFENGKMEIKSYNKAFIADLKEKLGDIGYNATDEQLIDLYLGRENLEREEPKLDIVHSGINEDGTIKMQLDWNRAFINHLRENGIDGETEEEAIENYLQLLTRNVDAAGEPTNDAIEKAFAEVDAELGKEFEAARLQSASGNKKKRRRGFSSQK